ncbi:myosin-10-like isoform X2 [Stegodyphus dumicola]|uniref:myosin-10-like isoform X2 n=1 Tax=Stegodyphus dumicola TaxID=202533 RepID=UPI0015AE3D16|nr:myosin-10-like isoform X2 [Stegodyphus dumicola]
MKQSYTYEMMGQKCFVTLKMHQQLYKEHLSLQKSFCTLYKHMSEANDTKQAIHWFHEKIRLQATLKQFKSQVMKLQRQLEESNERCELLEFCLLELENQGKTTGSEDFEDKGVNTDLDWKTWERNILKDVPNYSSWKETEQAGTKFKENEFKAEMETTNYRLQLEEAQKKLSSLTEQLDNAVKCNCKLGVGMDYVIATVNELQSLIKWTAGKMEIKADSGVIFQKLQQLERIQKDLEKTATESEQIRCRAEHEKTSCTSCNEIEQDIKESDTYDAALIDMCDTESQSDQLLSFDYTLRNLDSMTSSLNLLADDQANEANASPLVDLDSPEKSGIECSNVQVHEICSDNKDHTDESHDSLGHNISEDEGLGEESRRGDSTGPSSIVEIQDTVTNLSALNAIIEPPLKSKIIVLDPEGNEKSKNEWVRDLKEPLNSLDFCLCAIENLRESLKAKENELLKLTALQNDQKQIAALQDVIVNFHKDTLNLRSQLELEKKEKACLKEQVLELEEAENDARLQAQKLGEKLIFLQEKDSHFQVELCETKKALEKCFQELAAKETEERELKSQLKYTEALVQKYEEQVRGMEITELELRKKLIEKEEELRASKLSNFESKPDNCEKGTQTYYPQSKSTDIFSNGVQNNENFCMQSNDISTAVSHEMFKNITQGVDCAVQTENDIAISCEYGSHSDREAESANKTSSAENSQDLSTTVSLSNLECPVQKELLKRLHQLVEEDAHLQQQLHYVDQINLTLWKKLHNLEFHIGECKRKNISDDCTTDSCTDSECDLSSRPLSREQIHDECVESKDGSPSSHKGIIACLDQSEQEIKERLMKLEQINASFEKELENREKLYLEKERKYGEWMKTEQKFIGDLKRLEEERDCLVEQVSRLQKEKEELVERVHELEKEMENVKERHRLETEKMKAEQDKMTQQLELKVDQLLAKEKEHLKQITNLKIERSKSDNRTESEKLKASYVELQIELSRTRDKIRTMEEDFKVRMDETRSKHMLEEARLLTELEMLRNKNLGCDEMINSFQLRQNELMSILRQKEQDLEQARLEYKRNMEATEEAHRKVEAELKRQLREMEEGTALTTQALTDERMRLEKELQENIDDLKGKEEVYKARIAELENNVSHLHDELHRITGDIDSGFGSEPSTDSISNFRREKLLNQLRELRDREAELREKLDEMEQKEAAYRETLEHADRIVASVEQGYKNKIEELEISERNLKQRVGHLEAVESHLRGVLHKERRSSDGRKPDDLVVELLEAEARETGLKENIERLEQLQRSSMNKVKDLEKLREKLEAQLCDRDELSSNLQKTQQELDLARKSVAKLKKSEEDLKTSLQQTESVLATTESQMRNKIKTIEEEKRGLEETVEELRAQVRDLKNKLERISDDEEEERMSVAIPNQSSASSSLQKACGEDIEDADYTDVDDSSPDLDIQDNKPNENFSGRTPIKTPLSQLSSLENFPGTPTTSSPTTIKTLSSQPFSLGNFPGTLAASSPPPIKIPSSQPFSLGNFPGSLAASSPASIKTPTSEPSSLRNFPDTPASSSLFQEPNRQQVEVDSYDSARQNFEDCMMKAMAAMKHDLQAKKINRENTEKRMKFFLSDQSRQQTTPQQVTSQKAEEEEHDYDEVLPRPTNFRVVQRVGSDTLLVGWDYVNPALLEGFEDEDDDEDEDSLFEDSVYEKNRPYSMEW